MKFTDEEIDAMAQKARAAWKSNPFQRWRELTDEAKEDWRKAVRSVLAEVQRLEIERALQGR